jgi:hypothetical protein
VEILETSEDEYIRLGDWRTGILGLYFGFVDFGSTYMAGTVYLIIRFVVWTVLAVSCIR